VDLGRPSFSFKRSHAILLGVVLAFAAGVMLFDWNWLRPALVNYLAKKSGREIRIDDLHIDIGWPIAPTVRLRGVRVENAAWASRQPMAVAAEAAFTFAAKSLWSDLIVVTRLVLVDADVSMERKADGLRNWRLTNPEDRGPGIIRVMTLDARRSTLHFINEAIDFEIVAKTAPVDGSANVPALDDALLNDLTVKGKYQGVPFTGAARIGTFMSFRDSLEWFPLRGHLSAGKTRLDIDGKLADIFDLGPVDAQIRLAGDSLAHVHPFLQFKPPPTRAYRLEAKLRQENGKYEFTQLKGKVGDADFAGDATYDRKPERRVATATLDSGSADLIDLVFLAGMDYRRLQSQNASAPDNANAKVTRIFSARVLNIGPMQKFDAHMKLAVKKFRAAAWPVDSLRLTADLVDGVLRVSELDLGAAGGHVAGSLEFDAKQEPPAVRANLDGRNLRLARVMFPKPAEVTSEGGVRAQLRASGSGKSFAAMAGSATGTLAAVVDGGSISNLVDAKLALNLGKVLGLRIRGDRPIPLHCAAAAFDFRNGIGKSQALVLETAETHTDGTGVVDLRNETFELLLTPQPKKPGLFSLKSSIRVQGALNDASYKIDDRIPLKPGGAAAAPSTIATLFKPLLNERRQTSQCAHLLAPLATAMNDK